MKYIPPRDAVADTDPYIDENASAGISGSIVPAAAFNWLLGEVVDVITRAGLTPDDVLQLYDAIAAMVAAGGGGGGGGVLPGRLINSGEGLQGGGDLSADRTLALNFAGLTTEASPNVAHLVAIWNGTNHRKVTISALASLLAASGVQADTITETSLSTSLGTYTFASPAAIALTDRFVIECETSMGSAYAQAEIDSVWQTIGAITAPSQLHGGGTAYLRIGFAYNQATGHFYRLTSPLSFGTAGIQGDVTAGFAGPYKAELMAGTWSGKVRVSGATGRLKQWSPASLA